MRTKYRNRPQKSLEQYLKEIGNYSTLNTKEEIHLAQEIAKGDEDALKKLTRANLRFVVSVAKDYQNRGLPLSDLINEGNIGLIRAARRYDETRGFKFISYAVWWIRQTILQALAEQSRVIRLPLNRVGAINRIRRVRDKLEKGLERKPNTHEIAEELDIPTNEVFNTIEVSGRHLSLEAPISTGESHRLLDIIHDDGQTLPDSRLDDESLKGEIQSVLESLSPREALVIKYYFGLGLKRAFTLEEIGDGLRLTRERVRQIKEKAIRRLKHKSRSRKLRKYLV
jgi:RNA polymerase primary sigma factor